jgi:Ca2+:H+ antiporter
MIGLWFTLRAHASMILATAEHHSHQPQHSNHLDSGEPQGTRHQQGEPQQPRPTRSNTFLNNIGATGGDDHDQEGGGHDAPNWSRRKSSIILLTATVAYAIIAEVLVDAVDVLPENVDIDENSSASLYLRWCQTTTEFLVCKVPSSPCPSRLLPCIPSNSSLSRLLILIRTQYPSQ